MVRILQLKLEISHSDIMIKNKIERMLRLKKETKYSFKIVKRSLDARKKPELYFSYIVDVDFKDEYFEQKLVKKLKNKDILFVRDNPYIFENTGNKPIKSSPVIIGSGPAGIFCGLMLARCGFAPVK